MVNPFLLDGHSTTSRNYLPEHRTGAPHQQKEQDVDDIKDIEDTLGVHIGIKKGSQGIKTVLSPWGPSFNPLMHP
jgi:hypothetical protein